MEYKLPFEKVKKKVLVKKKAETNIGFGCRPEGRNVEDLIKYGIVNLNKPSGPTSHQVTDYIKRIFNVKRAGHSGTLDPKVTGCLPIALDKATRVVQFLLTAGKEYVCLMHVHGDHQQSQIISIMKSFEGRTKQVPPKKSSVKRVEREREIYYVNILEINGRDILFRVGCQAGTYIRKLCWQIGKDLGSGAHMTQLVRTKAGPFTDKSMVTLHDLKDAYEFWKEGNEKEIRKVVLPFERAIEHLAKIWVFDSAVDPLCHGSDLYVSGISVLEDPIMKNELVAIMTLKDELICVGKAEMDTNELLEKSKGVAVKADKVFMDRGIYSL